MGENRISMVRIMDALRAAIPGQAPLADEKAAHAKTRRQLADTEAELGALRARLESA